VAFAIFALLLLLVAAWKSEPPLKPVLRGVVALGGPPPPAYQALTAGFSVNVSWRELQPRPGESLVNTEAIDQALTAAGRLGLRVKLRVLAGTEAPEWVQRIGGAPVPVGDDFDDRGGMIGRFWLPEYGAAYDELQRKLSDRYDDVPELAQVEISRCTTVYAEPLQRQRMSTETVRALLWAGYSVAADLTCHQESIASHRRWIRTRSGLAVNPYQVINDDGTTALDPDVTVGIMGDCRQVLQLRCVLENNSIRWPPLGSAYAPMYEEMEAQGSPLAFQTAGPRRLGNWVATLEWAVEQGANAVETPMVDRSKSTLERLHAALAANPVPD
jgi:hypothetical protein